MVVDVLKDYRRNIGVSAVLAGLTVVVINYIEGDLYFATVLLLLLLLLLSTLLWWTQPGRSGPHLSHAAAQAAAGDGDVIVYWRPGCRHCDRLMRGLGRARRDVLWVDITRDSAAGDFVATLHDGDRTVPTAVTGAGKGIEATAAAIKARLEAEK